MTAATPVTVVIVDDDPLVVNYLTTVLDSADKTSVVGTALDGAAGVEAAIRYRPDVLLMDIRMPGITGIDAAREISSFPDPPRVVLITTIDSDRALIDGLHAGAAGLLLKAAAPELIIQSVLAAARGIKTFSPEATDRLARLAQNNIDPHHSDSSLEQLSEREVQVLRAVREGLSNADIGRELYLAESTVKGHVSRLMIKLGCRNRAQLAVLAHEQNI